MARLLSFSSLNDILPYIHIYHIFFIWSSIDGQLDCFHSWLLSKLLQWTWRFRYLLEIMISFSLNIYAEVELLDHTIAVFLIFWGTSTLFSIVAVPVCIPLTVHKDSFFSTSSQTRVILCLFDGSSSNRCEMIFLGFDLCFPDY